MKGALAFATIRKIDSFGLGISFPGGHSGYVKSDHISDIVSQGCVKSVVTGTNSK